jgi:hypothetical protein
VGAIHEILAENFRWSQVATKVAEHLISANRSQVTGLAEQFEMVQYFVPNTGNK